LRAPLLLVDTTPAPSHLRHCL